jgi:acyl-CoA oxidase
VLDAARAHIDRVVLDAFVAAIERCKDRKLVGVLNQLCDLYALSDIERDRGCFQEHGRVSSTRSKAITRKVNSLCAELRDHAGSLVDAFGIPDAILAAPIGLGAKRVRPPRRFICRVTGSGCRWRAGRSSRP